MKLPAFILRWSLAVAAAFAIAVAPLAPPALAGSPAHRQAASLTKARSAPAVSKLPFGSPIRAWGDSRTQQEMIWDNSISGFGKQLYASGTGPLNVALALDPRANANQWPDPNINGAIPSVTQYPGGSGTFQGENGAPAAQMLIKISNYIAAHPGKGPGFVDLIEIGVNGNNAAVEWDGIQKSIRALKAWGAERIIVRTPWGVTAAYNGGGPSTTAKNTFVYDLNNLIFSGVAAYNDPNIIVSNEQLAVKGDNLDGAVPSANLGTDGIHANRITSARAAGPLLTAIQSFVEAGNMFDDYSTRYVNLMASAGVTTPAGDFLTTTGAALSNGVTGDGPATLTISGPGAGRSTAVASMDGNDLVLTITPAGSNASDTFTWSWSPNSKLGSAMSPVWSAVPGSYVRGSVVYEFGDNGGGLAWPAFTQPTAVLSRTPFDASRTMSGMHFDGLPSIMYAGKFTVMTPSLQMDASATGIYFVNGRILVNPTGATGTGVIRIKNVAAHLIADPTMVFH